MKPTAKLILVLFGLAYLISPVDIIPDLLLPPVGWIDDGLVLWCIYRLIRYGELPWFLFKRPQRPQPVKGQPAGTDRKSSSPGAEKTNQKRSASSRKEKKDRSGASGASPYDTLGVDPQASWDEIQKAYKQKIKQYHPDKLSHLGEEFSSLANKKFLEIQTAYNRLKSMRNKS